MGADPLPSRLPLPAIVDHPSPNHGPRRGGTAPDMIVLHYTGMASAAAALDRLCDPAAQVSAHYLVDEDGAIRRLVDEQRRAWHAGHAHWAGEADINSRSIGIEIVNGGHDFGLPTYPAVQVDAVVALVGDICARRAIPPARVVGHADVAPARKADPGEHFPWWRLAAAGLALAGPAEGAGPAEATGPAVDKAAAACLGAGCGGSAVRALQGDLAAIGYALSVDGRYGAQTVAVVTAFQRRFRPDRLDGVADGETRALVRGVAKACRKA